jgi:hypothetical protein
VPTDQIADLHDDIKAPAASSGDRSSVSRRSGMPTGKKRHHSG